MNEIVEKRKFWEINPDNCSLRWLALLKKKIFMDWFYYNLIILIKYCKILYKNLDKAVFEKKGILSENLKTLTSSSYPAVQCFLLNLHTRFLLTNAYKRGCGIFFILFRSWVICKNLKRPGFYKLVFYTFINNSRSKQNKKIPHNLLETLLSRKRVQNFSKNY